jgi:uncharacterized protein DUF4349
MSRWFWIFIVAAGASLALAACARSEPSRASDAVLQSSAPAVPGAGTAVGSAGAADTDRTAGPVPGARERMLVRSAALRLEVEEYSAARESLDVALERTGGHVARARVEHADGTVAFASLELRVPARALDAFVREVARFGTVLHEEMRTDEISDEYYDARARLESAQKLEQRLLEFAGAKTSDVKGLLEVERESSGTLLRTGRGALVVLAFLLPWLPVLAVASYFGRRLLRR